MKKLITTLISGTFFCCNIFSQSFSDIQNEKTFEMFNSLQCNNENLFISPLGVRLAFGIFYYGIEDEEQKNQWEQYLGIFDSISRSSFNQLYDFSKDFAKKIEMKNKKNIFPSNKDFYSKLEISNALKYKMSMKLDSNYLRFLTDSLNVILFPFEDDDFQVNAKINSWISANSNQKIKKNSSQNENAIINLVYFLGEWECAFDKKFTKKRAFFAHEKKIRAETMYKKNQYSYYENKNIQVIKLPYKGSNISMIILCPKKKNVEISGINIDYWKSIVRNFKSKSAKLYLPKFSYSSNFAFDSDFVEKHGIHINNSNTIFHEEKYLFSRIFQNTFIEIDEEKTEAYAITSIISVTGPKTKKPKPIVFRANKPFLFFIVDEQTDLILFTGKYIGK